jgi:hypothetical protein
MAMTTPRVVARKLTMSVMELKGRLLQTTADAVAKT